MRRRRYDALSFFFLKGVLIDACSFVLLRTGRWVGGWVGGFLNRVCRRKDLVEQNKRRRRRKRWRRRRNYCTSL